MPKIIRKGPATLELDFSDLDHIDAPRIINDYLGGHEGEVSIYELQRIFVDGIMWEVRNDQAGVDGNMCDTTMGDLPCGNPAEFVMEDGAKICFECYRIFLQRYGEHTGKKFKEIE